MSGGRYAGSTRRRRLPKNWPTIRKRILHRDDHVCTWRTDGIRCGAPATDIDHIIPGDDHSDANLRSLCVAHHRTKSAREGGQAAAARRIPRARPAEPHPGLLP